MVLNFYLNSLDNNKEALNTAINYKDSNAELCYLAVSPTAQHQLYNTLLAEVPGVARVILKTLFKKIRIYKPKISFFSNFVKKTFLAYVTPGVLRGSLSENYGQQYKNMSKELY